MKFLLLIFIVFASPYLTTVPWQDYPYIGSIVDLSGGSLCTCTFIDEDVVLTSSRCVHEFRSFDKMYPQMNIKIKTSENEYFKVRNIVIHPEYDRTGSYMDLGVIFLKKKVRSMDVSFHYRNFYEFAFVGGIPQFYRFRTIYHEEMTYYLDSPMRAAISTGVVLKHFLYEQGMTRTEIGSMTNYWKGGNEVVYFDEVPPPGDDQDVTEESSFMPDYGCRGEGGPLLAKRARYYALDESDGDMAMPEYPSEPDELVGIYSHCEYDGNYRKSQHFVDLTNPYTALWIQNVITEDRNDEKGNGRHGIPLGSLFTVMVFEFFVICCFSNVFFGSIIFGILFIARLRRNKNQKEKENENFYVDTSSSGYDNSSSNRYSTSSAFNDRSYGIETDSSNFVNSSSSSSEDFHHKPLSPRGVYYQEKRFV